MKMKIVMIINDMMTLTMITVWIKLFQKLTTVKSRDFVNVFKPKPYLNHSDLFLRTYIWPLLIVPRFPYATYMVKVDKDRNIPKSQVK